MSYIFVQLLLKNYLHKKKQHLEDKISRQCINCKTESTEDNKVYKVPDKDGCVTKPDNTYIIFKFIININIEILRYIRFFDE